MIIDWDENETQRKKKQWHKRIQHKLNTTNKVAQKSEEKKLHKKKHQKRKQKNGKEGTKGNGKKEMILKKTS